MANSKRGTMTADEAHALGALTDVTSAMKLLGFFFFFVCELCNTGAVKAVKIGHVWRINTASLLEFAGLL